MTRTSYIGIAMTALLCMPLATGAQQPPQKAPPTPPAPATKEQTQRQEVRKEVGEAVDSIRTYSFERRQEALAVARRSMDELDAQFDRMQAQSHADWTKMSEATRSRSQRTAAELRRQRNALSEWYGGMRQSSAEAWTEVKGNFIASYHDMVASMQRARDDLRGQPPEQQDAKPEKKADQRK
ncbi:hypothetical protein [Lysobacter soli]|jgi:hypothetical protein|uniref:hypothetical protein n=1 Tax=Lysobacter soli TaxID=453783 RepID=UPI002410172C|nr:hypothetical protein [Lysobacter soli]MDG2518385.1 hypothetical protein [Lysobacter soli]